MSSLVIVAIPAEDEVVYKVSSEKVPHLTLMYLGETSEDHNVQRMAEFVDHALTVNQHGPFHLSVDYRGELGADKADVLFFEGGWDTKWIKSLRSQLLKQSDIRAAYEQADTFPDWVPHLTLGYPDSPAKPLPNEYGKIYGVQFDRIAVWDGNYEGPEFRLRWPEREELESDMAVAWSLSEAGEEHVIKHYGVKGMRWGVHRDDVERAAESSTSKVGKAVREASKFARDVEFEADTRGSLRQLPEERSPRNQEQARVRSSREAQESASSPEGSDDQGLPQGSAGDLYSAAGEHGQLDVQRFGYSSVHDP
jgi:2'-5' RNA ligase